MQHTTVFQQHNLHNHKVMDMCWSGSYHQIWGFFRKLFKAVGNQICAVLTAPHRITGYDITSGVGIKKAILNVQAEKYFKHFEGHA